MTEDNKQSRRNFILSLGVIGAVIVAAFTFLRNSILFVFPKKEKKTFHKYLVAKQEELPPGKAKMIVMGKEPVFVVHLEEGFKVFSGVCTHLGCIVRWEEEKDRFYCPCHKGIFDKSGKVTGGPPPRPLDEYRVEVEDKLVFMYVEDKKRSPWT